MPSYYGTGSEQQKEFHFDSGDLKIISLALKAYLETLSGDDAGDCYMLSREFEIFLGDYAQHNAFDLIPVL